MTQFLMCAGNEGLFKHTIPIAAVLLLVIQLEDNQ